MSRTLSGVAAALSLILLAALSAVPANAQTAQAYVRDWTTCPPPDSFDIYIQSVENVNPGTSVSLDIFALPSDNILDSFNLRIAYDSARMTFVSAEEGQLFADCHASYFRYQAIGAGQLLIENGIGADTCDRSPTEPYLLATLNFRIDWDPFLAGAKLPIQFYWTDCIDNMFSCDGDKYQLVARRVFDYNGTLLPFPFLFPTFGGVPGWCVTCDTIFDVITFRGGYVGISNEISPPRGDCDGDGIAFTVADYELFKEYFEAPCIPDQRCGCGDPNGDGVENHVSDLIYMYGVINGDILPEPVPGPSEETAYIYHDIAGKKIRITGGGGDVAGVRLILSGQFNPTELPPDVSLFYQDGDFSYLTLSLSPYMLSGPEDAIEIGYTGSPYIEEAQASTPDGLIMSPDVFRTGQYAVSVDVIQPEDPPYGIALGDTVDVDVTFTGPTAVLDGIEMQLSYDAGDLELLDAFGDSWESFSYRTGPEDGCLSDACPSGLLHVSATNITERTDGTNSGSAAQGLFTMRFVVTSDESRASAFVPIRFLWSACGDNRVVSGLPAGSWASASVKVYDPDYQQYFDSALPLMLLPTTAGAPSSCVVNNEQFSHRYVDYFNGGVQLIDSAFLNVRGDLNVDGEPFTANDAVRYVDYFLKGTSVFPEPVRELAIFASDCDLNGTGLSTEDYMYLWNVLRLRFTADEPPRGSAGEGTLFHKRTDGIVSFDSPDTLGAIWLHFDGQVRNPRLFSQAAHLSMGHFFDGSRTSVFVSVWEADDVILPGVLFYYDGTAVLSEVCAATIHAEPVPCRVDVATDVPGSRSDILPEEYVLAQNYPNPFNPTSTIRYGLPHASNVTLAIYNVTGQLVRTLVNRWEAAGTYEVMWDGADESGEAVASGVYFYRLETDGYSQSRKMILLK